MVLWYNLYVGYFLQEKTVKERGNKMAMVYTVDYTLPNTMGKKQTKTFKSAESRRIFMEAVKAKGGNIKGTSSYDDNPPERYSS